MASRRAGLRITKADRAYDLLARGWEDEQRRRGRFRELVLEQLRIGKEPRPMDVAKALCQPLIQPRRHEGVKLTVKQSEIYLGLPSAKRSAWLSAHVGADRIAAARARIWQRRLDEQLEVCKYVAEVYVNPDARPRKTGRPSGSRRVDDRAIVAAFAKLMSQSPRRRPSRPEANRLLADQFKYSLRQIERITEDFDINN
jgi:hypothetical protein